MKQPTNDHYSTLGVLKTANDATIKHAYRKRASKAHPDRGGSADEMAALNKAWECLGDPQRRLTYDSTGHDESIGPTVNEAGRACLMDFFDRCLNEGNAENILGRVHHKLLEQRGGLLDQRKQFAQTSEALIKARNKVQRKGDGLNVYQLLIDQRLKTMKTGSVMAERRLLEIEEALVLLEDYSETSPTPRATFIRTSGTASTTTRTF